MFSNFRVILCQILSLHACKMLYWAILHLNSGFVYGKERARGITINTANDIPFFVELNALFAILHTFALGKDGQYVVN